ncbi:PepSY domain-containing protein [Psychrosphaera haliotis]|uniref:PepSY domain-containing protein n=1 Tax=Psychrosphaera haliotis TaxID=555083 RepID=A0A6N8FBE8_9GAMM|nr:PepSY domain-containing protein [Psychrosphaera haliotis]MUH73444.1 hypothetical protein [Psychrosphaera haliotis]
MLTKRANAVLHKWLATIVSIQLVIWLGTGLYFGLADDPKASGNQFRQKVEHKSEGLQTPTLIAPEKLSSKLTDAKRVSLVWRLDKPYYLAFFQEKPHGYQKQSVKWFDAETGALWVINENYVTELAQQSLKHTEKAKLMENATINLISRGTKDIPSERNTIWAVALNNTDNTTIYISDVSRKVIAHVDDHKRLKNLMFQLHFMDYFNTGGFNNIFSKVFALLTLMLAITGLRWLFIARLKD